MLSACGTARTEWLVAEDASKYGCHREHPNQRTRREVLSCLMIGPPAGDTTIALVTNVSLHLTAVASVSRVQISVNA